MTSPKPSGEFNRIAEDDKRINNPTDVKKKHLRSVILTEEAKIAKVIDNTQNVVKDIKSHLKENKIDIFGFTGNTNSGKEIKKLSKEDIHFFETTGSNSEQMKDKSSNEIPDANWISSSIENNTSGETSQVEKKDTSSDIEQMEKNKFCDDFIGELERKFKEGKISLLDLVIKRETLRADIEKREKIDYSMCYERGKKLVTGHSFHIVLTRDVDTFIDSSIKYARNKGLKIPITKKEYLNTIDTSMLSTFRGVISPSQDVKEKAGYASILYEFMWRNEPILQLDHWPQDRSGYPITSLLLGGFLGDATGKVYGALRELTGQTIDAGEHYE